MMRRMSGMVCGLAVALFVSAQLQAQVEDSIEAKWYAGAGLGYLNYEGDQVLEDGAFISGRVGYDWNEWWSIEGMLFLAPSLDENFVGDTYFDPATGQDVKREVSQAPQGEQGFGSTFAFGTIVDALFHFTRWERIDPFLAVGGGLTFYGDTINGKDVDASVRAGGGLMYHFNDEWACRGDIRTLISGNSTEVNLIYDVSAIWYWGAHVPAKIVAHGGPLDSDGDGLTDDLENDIGTDPYDPDTDKDGLSDGEEYHQYRTDPLNPDTDYDGLTDGNDEVSKYRTNPLMRDTDNGGVADGHEVIEDGTDPLDPSDDLRLFELNIQFDYNRDVVKQAYFEELSVVAKVLQRNPEASARIEGHADQTSKSKKDYNRDLSERRAQAVLNHLAKQGGIAKSRMAAHGYGFSRPKAPNDPRTGNPVNRRVEIYIRGANGELTDTGTPTVLE